jgi:hypothetical protein
LLLRRHHQPVYAFGHLAWLYASFAMRIHWLNHDRKLPAAQQTPHAQTCSSLAPETDALANQKYTCQQLAQSWQEGALLRPVDRRLL